MNTRQKNHQLHLQQWAPHFQEQAKSGLTTREWCTKNGFILHSYNYWKHLIKQEYVDSMLPEIVPLTACSQAPVLPSLSESYTLDSDSNKSRELHNSHNSATLCISCGDIKISIGSSVSEESVVRIFKAVRYA